jgi:hypothetical protein
MQAAFVEPSGWNAAEAAQKPGVGCKVLRSR